MRLSNLVVKQIKNKMHQEQLLKTAKRQRNRHFRLANEKIKIAPERDLLFLCSNRYGDQFFFPKNAFEVFKCSKKAKEVICSLSAELNRKIYELWIAHKKENATNPYEFNSIGINVLGVTLLVLVIFAQLVLALDMNESTLNAISTVFMITMYGILALVTLGVFLACKSKYKEFNYDWEIQMLGLGVLRKYEQQLGKEGYSLTVEKDFMWIAIRRREVIEQYPLKKRQRESSPEGLIERFE